MSERETIHYVTIQSKLGQVLVAQSDNGIVAVLLNNEPLAMVADLQNIFPEASLKEGDGVMDEAAAKVACFIEDPRRELDVSLDVRGTDFEKKVWNALRQIPAGETRSYAQVAQSIDLPNAARAVGSACARNVLAMLIPCHRVITSGGKISGYRWGPELKRAILSMEAA